MNTARYSRASACMLVVTAFLSGCSESNAPPAPPSPEPVSGRPSTYAEIQDADVIVIGAGLAGLSAAIEAASSGRTVLVIDMASVFGGHAVMSAGGMAIVDTPMQRETGIEDDTETAVSDFIEWGEDVDREWVQYYVENSRELIYDWATGLGVEFNIIRQPPGNTVPRMHFPNGLGLGLIDPLVRHAVSLPGIQWAFNTRAESLLEDDGSVVGVRSTNVRTGTEREYRARAVVIATGGYQSNLDRVRENWRDDLPAPGRLLAGSGWNSQGSGLNLATAVGADLHRIEYMWNYVTGVPDPRYDDGDRGLRMFIEGGPRSDAWVNESGERFVNECLSPKYALTAVLEQPGQSHWFLFDSATRPQVSVAGTGWTPEKVDQLIFGNEDLVVSATDIPTLAEQMGIDGDRLASTIDRYNALVENQEDEDFGRFGSNPDPRGSCAAGGQIAQPPFYAIKRYPLARKSLGGIRIDAGSRVMSTTGDLIPGLYAAGEVTGLAGINGRAGLEGTFLGPSLVTGRVAGRTIAADLAGIPVSALQETETLVPQDNMAESGEPACTTCHDIPTLTGLGRPGYRHFEHSHAIVTERGQDCADCHAGMPGPSTGQHVIEISALTDACWQCHGSGGD